MNTPFDDALAAIQAAKYHNHRLETHSDTVSQGIIRDLARICAPLADDLDTARVKIWPNVSAPGDRQRKVDLFVGEPTALGQPDVRTCRIAVENKSVITAHRNRTNRFDDLKKVLGAIHSVRPEALLVATVLVGLAERVLNVPDRLRPLFSGTDQEFDDVILPRLCVGDERLWSEFPRAVSRNSSTDPAKTVELFRTLPTRKPGLTHI